MPTVQFIGRILPDALKLTTRVPEIKWKWEEENIELTFNIKVLASIIIVECETPRYEARYFVEFHRRAFDLARGSVNLAAFAAGQGVIVTLDSFIAPGGVTSPIMFHDPRLAALCTSFSLDPARQTEYHTLLTIAITDINLLFALNDMIEAITIPHVSLVNCARAMDRLKHLIASPNAKDPQAWRQMRDALQISEDYLKYITEYSKGPRHGRPGHRSGIVTSETARRAWIIMDRYFEYRKRGGSNPLPVSSFPVLVT